VPDLGRASFPSPPDPYSPQGEGLGWGGVGGGCYRRKPRIVVQTTFTSNPLGVINKGMIVLVLSTISVVLVAALATCLVWVVRVVSRMSDEFQPLDSPGASVNFDHLQVIQDQVDRLERDLKACFQAVAEGIEHVDRNEKRVRGIVTGANRRFEAEGYVDPGVQAEEDSLPVGDATEGGNAPLPPVSNDVDPDYAQAWSGVPGDTSELMKR